MSKGLPIVTGYSTFEVRIRAVRAVLSGEVNVTETAITFGVDRSTVHRWIGRFQSEGEAGLVRAEVSGRPRKIEALDTEALCKIVLCPASQFGFETDFWTTPRLIQIVAEKFGVSLSKQSMMRRLHEAGMTYQKPERVYFEMSEEVRQKWRRTELRKIRAAVKNYKAILYFQDEANVSLTALLGKTWAIRGQTPKQRVTGNRGGVSAMSAITSGGQLIFRLHDKRIASDEVIDFLSQMLRHHPRRHLVVVMDQAAPHVSKKTKCFIENQRRQIGRAHV